MLLFCKLLDYVTTTAGCMATRLLAYWYSHHVAYVRWQYATSISFGIQNGVWQGGILSPFLFRFYIRDLIKCLHSTPRDL